MDVKYAIITTSILMVFLQTTSTAHTPCKHGPNASKTPHQAAAPAEAEVCKVKKSRASSPGLHDSFALYPPFLNSVMTLDKFRETNPGRVDIKYSYLTPGRKTCNHSDVSNYTLDRVTPDKSQRIICPLVWMVNYDVNRAPRTILEAWCLHCPNCKGMNPASLTMGCAPVRYHTKVLRRKSRCNQAGFYQYEEVYEPITVGCVCQEGVMARPSQEKPSAKTCVD